MGALPASAQLFGPSDEEKAAAKAHEDGQDDAIQQSVGRIQQLEDRVRSLTQSLANATGISEDLQHQIQQQNQKIESMQRDFAYRLCTLSAQQLGAGDSMNCAAAGTASANGGFAPPAQTQGYGGPQTGLRPGDPLPPLSGSGNDGGDGAVVQGAQNGDGPVLRGRGPGTLGTLPVGPSTASNGPVPYSNFNGAPASAARNADQYDTGMNLMARAQYAEATAAFRGYADANPNDPRPYTGWAI
jgi:TolA-binding protein